MLPLADVTVVAVEQAVAAPFATRQLADLGARVIKVERPHGGDFARGYDQAVRGLSSHFVWLNRSKESLTLDLKQPAAAGILERLLARADVFIQNLAPGAAARVGLGADRLRERYPQLIICNINGYGESGPYRDKKAYDLLIQCEAGLTAVTGDHDTPCKVGVAVADIAAGMYAYSGILTALLQRQRQGSGSTLSVSLFDALAEWMAYPGYFTAYGGQAPQRTGTSHATIAPYGAFTSGDGDTVVLGLQNEREWVNFCERVLGDAALAGDRRFHDNSARVSHRAELTALIERVFANLSTADLIARLDAAGIANARLNDVAGFWSHTQLEARDRWRQVDSPAGPLDALLPPVISDQAQYRMDPIPALGEHSTAILEEMGYSAADIESLRGSGVV